MNVPHLAALITELNVVLLLVLSALVGRARGKYGINAPATTGNEEFERVFRVHANTIENTLVFLPALWMFAIYMNDLWAGILGAVWLVGRVWYAVSYRRDPKSRGAGFLTGMLASGALLIGGLWGILRF